MKILHITPGYLPPNCSGSISYARILSKWLAQSHEVVVFCSEHNVYAPNFLLSMEEEQGIKIYRINMAGVQEAFSVSAVDEALKEVLETEHPDIVHIDHLHELSLGIPIVIKQAGIPQIATLHDFWYMCPKGQFIQHNFHPNHVYRLCDGQDNYKCAATCYRSQMTSVPDFMQTQLSYWTKWVGARMEAARKAMDCLDLLVAPSAHLRERYIQDFTVPAEKIRHLPFTCTKQTYNLLRTNQDFRPFTFGFLCTMLPGEGAHFLLEAFGQLTAKAQLIIFGEPHGNGLSVLRSLAEACPLPVHFYPDYKPYAIRESVFEKVDCVVVPSLWMDNSPLSIYEAQACGIPVITANAGGMAELVHNRENGLLFEHRNAYSLAEQMAFAIENPEEMERMGQRGYLNDPQGRVPSLEQHGTTLLHWYEELIQQPHAFA